MVRRSADCWRKQYPFNSILAQRLQEVQLTLHRLSAVSQNKHSSEIFQRLLQARSDVGKVGRSEAHTSELQLLMRISYAVFCLKKKTTRLHYTHTQYITIQTTSRQRQLIV